MKTLFVLFDSSCGLCGKCARWLTTEPAYFDIRAIPSGTHRAAQLFPALSQLPKPEELIVIADTGEVYRGFSAWIMCLYALKRYRAWSVRLSRPGWSRLARRAVHFLTEHRDSLSGLLGLRASFDAAAGWGQPAPSCSTGACSTDPLVDRVRRVRGGPP